MARVIVLGAGIIGVASAWVLCRAGHQVTLVDQHSGPAQGASQANGAQLSYAYGDALASPSMLRHLPGIALGRDPAYRVMMQADPEYLLWGLRFLLNSTQNRFLHNTRALLKTAAMTQHMLAQLQRELNLSFDYAPSGKMILYGSAKACDASAPVMQVKRELGIRLEVLDRAQATAIEPALDAYPDPIERVIYTPDDAAGRPDIFCSALVEALKQQYGLTTLFDQQAVQLLVDRGAIAGLALRKGNSLDCEVLVMATGQSAELLSWRDRPWGSIWPVQGYSLTAPAKAQAMRVSITDLSRKIVFARLGNEVRAAGLADIGARQWKFDAQRFASFRACAIEAFGQTFEHDQGQAMRPWSGARPCTPSSQPIIRGTSVRGLFLNLGHGTLGWTLGLGSAAQLAKLVEQHN